MGLTSCVAIGRGGVTGRAHRRASIVGTGVSLPLHLERQLSGISALVRHQRQTSSLGLGQVLDGQSCLPNDGILPANRVAHDLSTFSQKLPGPAGARSADVHECVVVVDGDQQLVLVRDTAAGVLKHDLVIPRSV